MMPEFMRNSCAKSTWKNYSRKETWWLTYVEETTGSEAWGESLEKLSLEERIFRFMHFIQWLYTKNQRGNQVIVIVSNIKSLWEARGFRVGWMEDELIRRAKRATKQSVSELRAKPLPEDKVIFMGVTLEMVRQAKKLLWDNQDWETHGIGTRMKYLAMAVGLDSGNRPGNITLAEGGHIDHSIRGGDIVFYGKDTQKWKGVEEFRSFVGGESERITGVVGLKAIQATSKTAGSENGTNLKIDIQRRTEMEEELLEDLCLWFVMAKTMDGDTMFTKRHPAGSRKKTLTKRELREAIRSVAESMELNPDVYTNKSLRIGFATQCAEWGVPIEERNRRGGWTNKSTTPEKHYVRYENKGLLARVPESSEGSERR